MRSRVSRIGTEWNQSPVVGSLMGIGDGSLPCPRPKAVCCLATDGRGKERSNSQHLSSLSKWKGIVLRTLVFRCDFFKFNPKCQVIRAVEGRQLLRCLWPLTYVKSHQVLGLINELGLDLLHCSGWIVRVKSSYKNDANVISSKDSSQSCSL